MDILIAGLHIGVFAAALLQAATGIGFGIIAGPILLIVMGSTSAVHVSILLSLFISALIVPTLRHNIDRVLLVRLVIGSLVGLPLGIYLFLHIELEMLKFLAAIVVAYMAAVVWRAGTAGRRVSARPERHGWMRDFATGLLSGVMTTSLAMPGPPVASRLMVLARTRDVVRATTLALFVISYTAAILVQAAWATVSEDTLIFAAWLIPSATLGLLVGGALAGKFSEAAFRILISAILALTACALLANSSGVVVDLWT